VPIHPRADVFYIAGALSQRPQLGVDGFARPGPGRELPLAGLSCRVPPCRMGVVSLVGRGPGFLGGVGGWWGG